MTMKQNENHTTLSIHLERPLISFDLETTGLNIREDRIVEISCVKIGMDGSRDIRTRRLNPCIPISKEASSVHGITDEDVANAPRFEQIARSLYDFLCGCDLTGFNLEQFDLPMLSNEFERVGIEFPDGPIRIIDARRIYMAKEPRTLAAAYKFYCGEDLDGAHSAEADAIAAAEVLLAQVQRYEDLPADIQALHEFCHPQNPDWLDPDGRLLWRDGKVCLGFGKHKHRSLEDLVESEADYLRWIAGANFSDTVVKVIANALDGSFPDAPYPEPSGSAPANADPQAA